MTVRYQLSEILFEWDEQKAQENQRKHAIPFESASTVFFDPFLQSQDDEWLDGERRETVIGLTESWTLLYVVYVWRGDLIRIISARRATRTERKRYESQ